MRTLATRVAPFLLLSMAVPIASVPAHAATAVTCGKWTVVPSPNLGKPPGSNANTLLAVAARTTKDAWAAGSAYRFGLTKNLILHWNGTAWTATTIPSISNENNQLTGLAVLGAKNVWAVGYATTTGSTTALIEHWNGTSWKMVTTHAPSGKNELFGIAALSASNIWAIGQSDQGSLTINSLLLHYNGSAWSSVVGPNPYGENELRAVTRVPGATDLWAVGQGYSAGWHTLILQLHTGAWSQSTGVDQGTPAFRAVAATSSTNAWILGNDQSTSPTATLGEQWDGGSWTVQTTPNPIAGSYSLAGAAAVGSTIWIAGDKRSTTNVDKTQTFKWTSAHGFSTVTTPTPSKRQADPTAVTRIPGTNHLWAVGSQYSNTLNNETLIESYC